MNVAVWVVTVMLSVVFAATGVDKLVTPKAKIVANPGQQWAQDFPPLTIKAIGVCEVLGALGLILPAVLDIATWLVPTAAIGLALIMVGAAITHLRRREYRNIVANMVLFAAAVFVAVERLGPQAL